MKVVIPGGNGHLGQILAQGLAERGHRVIVLSRDSKLAGAPKVADSKGAISYCGWDGKNQGDWSKEIDGADVVINLAGRSVNCRYTEHNKRAITESRILSTQAVGQAIAAASAPPRLWLQMSTATIYAHRYDADNDEYDGIIGGNEADAPPSWRFSIDVATAWERTCDEATVPPSTRKVKLRTAIVMSPSTGGPFDVLLRLVQLGLGGKAGSGRQYVSWIVDRDFERAIEFIIEDADLEGAVNLASPHPLPNQEFMRILREAWGTRLGLPAAEWMLELGAIPLQTETELILKSRRVVPKKLLESGFQFDFPDWDGAARDLCRRWRSAHK